MQILAVNPWIYDFAAYDLWLKPLGLLQIAGALRSLGCRVNLIDCLDRHHPGLKSYYKRGIPRNKQYGCGNYYNEVITKPFCLRQIPRRYKRYGFPLVLFEEEVKRLPPPEVILVSSGMTYWYPGVFEAISRLKQRFPEVPLILGGIYATLCYHHASRYCGADFISQGGDIRKLVKLIGKVTGKNLPEKDLTTNSPGYPAYDLYSRNDYIALRTSVGCPFNCSYCAVNLLSRGFEQRPPGQVVEEIEYFYKGHGVKNFVFYDDALLFREEEHFQEIGRLIADRGLNCYFHTPNGLHARFVSEDTARLMKEMGFILPRLSLETINPERQMTTGGKVSTGELKEAMKSLRKAGYSPGEVGVYLMMGMPGQEMPEVRETIQFVHSLGAKVLLVEYSPIPGTRDWELSGLEPDLDPLLHNNSLFPLYPLSEWKNFQELKDEAHRLNTVT
ncbi:MAG: B12-binding domain-containing radical SAM protein [Deltaproteobacteria bacterium]|nr:MAG: B12-binding domain-containing radical SAM protein [Deltaproteobacteria bacterium]